MSASPLACGRGVRNGFACGHRRTKTEWARRNPNGHVIALRRTRVGPFSEVRAITLEAIDAASKLEDGGEALARLLAPVESALSDLPELMVSPNDAASLVRGQAILIRGRDAPVLSGPAFATSKGRLIALGELDKGALHPTRVFNLG